MHFRLFELYIFLLCQNPDFLKIRELRANFESTSEIQKNDFSPVQSTFHENARVWSKISKTVSKQVF